MLGVFLAMFEFIFGRVWGVFGMSEVFLAMFKVFFGNTWAVFGMPEMHLAFLRWFWQCLGSFWPSVA